MILDGESLEPVGAVEAFLRDSEGLELPGRLKTEMHASIVELNTGICADAREATAAHLVLVWQERDDPNLLWHAQRAKEVGRNPHVVAYEPSYGPSASYYAWEAAGRPVHGVRR